MSTNRLEANMTAAQDLLDELRNAGWDNLDWDWTIGTDNARKRLGFCNYTRQRITLSKHYASSAPWSEVRETVLHEIAHVIAGSDAGHGAKWKRIARRIGLADPTRCASADMAKHMPKGRYAGACNDCGTSIGTMTRRSAAMMEGRHRCRPCGGTIKWTDTRTGQVVPTATWNVETKRATPPAKRQSPTPVFDDLMRGLA